MITLSCHIETYSYHATSKPVGFPCGNINENTLENEKIVIFI
jgi:hypothetical protein